jgi:hypothetical protein
MHPWQLFLVLLARKLLEPTQGGRVCTIFCKKDLNTHDNYSLASSMPPITSCSAMVSVLPLAVA